MDKAAKIIQVWWRTYHKPLFMFDLNLSAITFVDEDEICDSCLMYEDVIYGKICNNCIDKYGMPIFKKRRIEK